MPVFLIDFQTKPEKGEDENRGDDGLVEEVLGVYIPVRHSHCPVLSLSRHCSMLTERGEEISSSYNPLYREAERAL